MELEYQLINVPPLRSVHGHATGTALVQILTPVEQLIQRPLHNQHQQTGMSSYHYNTLKVLSQVMHRAIGLYLRYM